MAEIKTETLCVLPILGCLKSAIVFIDNNDFKNLIPVNDIQKEFISRFGKYKDSVADIHELESIAHEDIAVINSWLKDKGFDIKLDPKSENMSFAVASVLNILVSWIKKGVEKRITSSITRKDYSGVKLDEGVTASKSSEHQYPIIHIRTESGDVVNMTEIDSAEDDHFSIYTMVKKLNESDTEKLKYVNKVVFPMIDLNIQPDISWIHNLEIGKHTPNWNNWYVSQAKQQTKFKMDLKGARVESAMAMEMTYGCFVDEDKSIYEITKPFLIWIERPGKEIPLFMAILAEDVWKNRMEVDWKSIYINQKLS